MNGLLYPKLVMLEIKANEILGLKGAFKLFLNCIKPSFFRFTPVPDSVLSMGMQYGQMNSVLDRNIQSGLTTPYSGFQSTLGGMTSTLGGMASGILTPGWKTGIQTGTSTDLDLRKIGQARNRIMDIRLNQVWMA